MKIIIKIGQKRDSNLSLSCFTTDTFTVRCQFQKLHYTTRGGHNGMMHTSVIWTRPKDDSARMSSIRKELNSKKNDTFYLPLNFYYVLQVSLFANGKQIYEYQLWSIQIPLYKLCLKIVKNVSFCKKIVSIQQFLSDFVHLFFSKKN